MAGVPFLSNVKSACHSPNFVEWRCVLKGENIIYSFMENVLIMLKGLMESIFKHPLQTGNAYNVLGNVL